MPVIHVDSIDDLRLLPYRNLPSRDQSDGLFVAEGKWLTERLLLSPYRTHSIVSDERRLDDLAANVPADVPYYVVPQGQISELVGFKFHRGILACGHRRLEPTGEEELQLEQTNWLGVACIQVADQENLGGILRNCAAFGVQNIWLGPACCDPLSRRVLRVSMGTALKLNIIQAAADLGPSLADLQSRFQADIVATVLDDTAEPLDQYQKSPRTILVLGSEGHGLESEWIARCNRRLTIPMQLGTDSLNVAAASGILLYSLSRASS